MLAAGDPNGARKALCVPLRMGGKTSGGGAPSVLSINNLNEKAAPKGGVRSGANTQADSDSVKVSSNGKQLT